MISVARAMSVAVLLGSLAAAKTTAVTGGTNAEGDGWADFQFLIGSWVSADTGRDGSGRFTLEPDLDGHVLVRRNVADVPAAKDRPAARHTDLMVVYRNANGSGFRASYFDNEDHVIAYAVTPLSGKQGLVFVSDLEPSAPRFRLTYVKTGEDTVAVTFESAPPGKPNDFAVYLRGVVRRQKPGE